MQNLVVTVLGNRNSGKSSTWNHIFEHTVKTGSNIRRLYLSPKEYVNVFLVSGSPEERELYVGDIIASANPRIVLCSVQYRTDVHQTIQYFNDNNYLIYCQWLNPGYHDSNDTMSFDGLGLLNYITSLGGIVCVRSGKNDLTSRCEELESFIYGWAYYRDLIQIDNG
jgi:hypothetical protein